MQIKSLFKLLSLQKSQMLPFLLQNFHKKQTTAGVSRFILKFYTNCYTTIKMVIPVTIYLTENSFGPDLNVAQSLPRPILA